MTPIANYLHLWGGGEGTSGYSLETSFGPWSRLLCRGAGRHQFPFYPSGMDAVRLPVGAVVTTAFEGYRRRAPPSTCPAPRAEAHGHALVGLHAITTAFLPSPWWRSIRTADVARLNTTATSVTLAQALAGTQIERHAGPTAGVDVQAGSRHRSRWWIRDRCPSRPSSRPPRSIPAIRRRTGLACAAASLGRRTAESTWSSRRSDRRRRRRRAPPWRSTP